MTNALPSAKLSLNPTLHCQLCVLRAPVAPGGDQWALGADAPGPLIFKGHLFNHCHIKEPVM